jgi:hypothetical protein
MIVWKTTVFENRGIEHLSCLEFRNGKCRNPKPYGNLK